MAKQVIDCSPSAGITTNQSNEHQRRWSEKNWQRAAKTGNYDITRAGLNFEIARVASSNRSTPPKVSLTRCATL